MCMGTMIQIRNVPDALHRQLKSRAALVAERPTLEELRARLQTRTQTTLPVPPADVLRAERDRA
jgi:plasmid stability protein